MKTIAIDIDDTLYSFGQLAREVFVDIALETGDKRLQRGAYCAWGEWRSPVDLVEPDFWNEVIDRCHTDGNILSQTPYRYAPETLHELTNEYDLIYISNRRESAWDATYAWLKKNDFPEGDLICTVESKMPLISHCQYIIDDRPKTLVEFVYDFDWKHSHGSTNRTAQRKGFGLFGEYNRALTDIPNIYLAPNWKLLRGYLITKGVLLASLVR